MLSASSPIPSSFSEQSIPSDSTPRFLVAWIFWPPGSVAPGGAKAARAPTVRLGAPHTTVKWRSAVATRQTPCLSIASTSPTTTPESPATRGAASATSMPAFVRRSATAFGDRSVSTNSLSQR